MLELVGGKSFTKITSKMSDKNENNMDQGIADFEEEDNNPFPHIKGLASLMSEHRLYDSDDKEGTSGGEKAKQMDDDPSVLLYKSNKQSNENKDILSGDTFKSIQINYESRVTRLLRPNSKISINIIKAGSSNEGMINSSKTYIVYTIQLLNNDDPGDEIQTRRRYSDFESLREILTKIYPLIIIPPIPPKNYSKFSVFSGIVGTNTTSNSSMNSPESNNLSGDYDGGPTSISNKYSYINSTHLNKLKLIEHRKRLLSNFLNNCLSIPQIRNLEFFAKFLDPNANWSDETALISNQLPKSIYHLNPENGLKTDPLYDNLPNPSNSHALNISFLKSLQENRRKLSIKGRKSKTGTTEEEPVNEASDSVKSSGSKDIIDPTRSDMIIDTSYLDSTNEKIMINFMGLANDYTELGTIFNSFSLVLSDSPIIRTAKAKGVDDYDSKLNIIFDKIGQVFDRSYVATNALIAELETKFSEPLGEAVQFTNILEFIQKFQRRKVKQQELVETELEDKKHELHDLTRAEAESSRIDDVLHSRVISKDSNFDFSDAASNDNYANENNNASDANKQQDKGKSKKNNSKFSSKTKYLSSINSFKKITQYVSEIIDQNPEETRKTKIVNIRKRIEILEKCSTIMIQDLSYIADEIEKNFTLFHKKQIRDMYEILLRYNGFLVGWAKKNLDIWEEVKEELERL